MFGTLAVIIGISTLFFAVLLGYLGFLNIFSLIILVGFFNIIQWLFTPYLINRLYKVREVKQKESPKLYRIVERLSTKSNVKKPKLGIANISLPNAFAYGSPIAGNHIAVTQGLLDTLEMEEVEAVLGHEFGHLKHRDIQIMMLVSFLPSLFYFLGRSAMFSTFYNRRRGEGGGTYLIGMASMLVYFVLLLFTMGLSRLREYHADRHSASIVEGGSRCLSEGLAKIVSKTGRMRMNRQREAFTFNSFKALFISDPDASESDSALIAQYAPEMSDQELVKKLLVKRISGASRLMELFSTHPNITKRLKALQGYSQ